LWIKRATIKLAPTTSQRMTELPKPRTLAVGTPVEPVRLEEPVMLEEPVLEEPVLPSTPSLSAPPVLTDKQKALAKLSALVLRTNTSALSATS
jgi:hypothetical protein